MKRRENSLFRVFVFGLAVAVAQISLPSLTTAQGQEENIHIKPRPQKEQPPPDSSLNTHTKPIKKDVDLVLIPATPVDPMNRIVSGFEKDNFEIYLLKDKRAHIDKDAKQEIKHFSIEDGPMSIGIILDISGSMKDEDKSEEAKQAVIEFLKVANPQDEFFLEVFNDRPEILTGFTNSPEEISVQLTPLRPDKRTSLLDAVYLGVNEMRQAKKAIGGNMENRKAILLISDGGDNRSRYTEDEIVEAIKEADVQIYSIGIFSLYPRTDEEKYGPELLRKISEATGGRAFIISNPRELPYVSQAIGLELRQQYVLGFKPKPNLHDGKYHKIKVKLLTPKGLPKLNLYYRQGYYAPSE